ncbi:hypothetical protein [Pseudoteredinibacter isoporae]|uniref:Uncharacterized protein n=1 Tax=Pseudoteredinibacter isoporae TaxID=570281 RepID=A0A7X0JTJ2_9GAMM|nr:hypothetical protein [Pseudoteredinibacter isoporae]MBB6521982.1 hypothetical protein [Pseudoteredinibacter isoporae]
MKKTTTAIAFSAFIMISQPGWSACSEPSQPNLPDPSTAVTPEMVKAKKEVKQYLADADRYLNCKRLNTRQHNAMVDKMQALANNFNQIIRQYKERQGS